MMSAAQARSKFVFARCSHITESGELRCSDPCCYVTQCAACERKQRANKKASNKVAKPNATFTKQKQVKTINAIDEAQAVGCEATVADGASQKMNNFRFDMTGARLEDDEREFTSNNWPRQMPVRCGAQVIAKGMYDDEIEVRGTLRGLAGVCASGSLNVTKYYIEGKVHSDNATNAVVICSVQDYIVTYLSEVITVDCDSDQYDAEAATVASSVVKPAAAAATSSVVTPAASCVITPAAAQHAGNTATTQPFTNDADEEIKNTVWTHASRCMLYGWVAKMNPWKAGRGKTEDAWDQVAKNVRESTKHLTKKEGKIELNGHALQVFLAKQLNPKSKYQSYKAKLGTEATLSGQAGMLNSHETKEFELLQTIESMKSDVKEEKTQLAGYKAAQASLKDGQMNDQIYNILMTNPEGQLSMFKLLSKKRKKLDIKIDALVEASKNKTSREDVIANKLDAYERQILEKYETMKADRRQRQDTTSDGHDSDENANRSNGKKARFHETINAINSMASQLQAPAGESPFEKALLQLITKKLEVTDAAISTDSMKLRLSRLAVALSDGLITPEEHAMQRQRIIASSF
jgi:hypothetical protein